MANKNDPPEHQAPDLESGFKPDPPNPETSGTHFDGPHVGQPTVPPDMSEMMVRVHGPGMYYVDEKGIAVPIPIQGQSPTGRINITPPQPAVSVTQSFNPSAGVLPPQIIHLRKLEENSGAACGSPLSGPFTSWPNHIAILGSDFSKYLADQILKPNLCPDCVALLKPEAETEAEAETKPHPQPAVSGNNRPKSVAAAQVIHARNTLVNPPKKGEPIEGLCGMKMPPGPKKLGDTLPSDRTVSDQVFRRYLLNGPGARPANSTLCGTCIMRFTPNPKPSIVGDLVVSHTALVAPEDQHDYPEMPKTGDKMYFNENSPVPVVVLPGQRFEDIESGQKGHIIAQNLGTYLVDFKAEDDRVFKGLRQSRFVRHSDLRQWIKDNPGAHWMFPPPAYVPVSEGENAVDEAIYESEATREAKERQASESHVSRENDLPLHTQEYNDTLDPFPNEPPLYTVVKGEADWQFFLHVPSPTPGDSQRTKWVNTRADWFSWFDVYPMAKKNDDFSPVILGTATTEEFYKIPTLDEWTEAKRKVREVMNFFRKYGLI